MTNLWNLKRAVSLDEPRIGSLEKINICKNFVILRNMDKIDLGKRKEA